MYLTKLAQRHGDNDQRVDYKDLAAVVQRKVNKTQKGLIVQDFYFLLSHNLTFILFPQQDSMEFLHDIVPKKITFAKYLEMIKNDKDSNDNTDEIM